MDEGEGMRGYEQELQCEWMRGHEQELVLEGEWEQQNPACFFSGALNVWVLNVKGRRRQVRTGHCEWMRVRG